MQDNFRPLSDATNLQQKLGQPAEETPAQPTPPTPVETQVAQLPADDANKVQPQQPQPQRAPTLDEYASGYNSVNFDLQRQAAAFKHFRHVVRQLETLAADTNANVGVLPFVKFTYAMEDSKVPGEYELDLNVLPPEMAVQFHALFALITNDVLVRMEQAWEAGHKITASAVQLIKDARAAQGVQA